MRTYIDFVLCVCVGATCHYSYTILFRPGWPGLAWQFNERPSLICARKHATVRTHKFMHILITSSGCSFDATNMRGCCKERSAARLAISNKFSAHPHPDDDGLLFCVLCALLCVVRCAVVGSQLSPYFARCSAVSSLDSVSTPFRWNDYINFNLIIARWMVRSLGLSAVQLLRPSPEPRSPTLLAACRCVARKQRASTTLHSPDMANTHNTHHMARGHHPRGHCSDDHTALMILSARYV